MDQTCLSIISHRCVIRLRSVESGGQVNTSNLFFSSNQSWTMFALWHGTLSYWKRPQPGKTVCMKGFTWSATMLRMVLRVKVTSSITLPLPACFLPMVHPGTICSPGNRPTNTRPSTWNIKENMIHRTRPPSSIAPLSSSDAHMPIVGSFLTGLRLCSPICNKLGCTVYPDTFLSEPTWTFSAIWETAVFGLDHTRPP